MYSHILVPFDGSATSTLGLDEAIRLAKASGGALRLVYLPQEMVYFTGFETACYNDLLPRVRQAGEALLERGRERVAQAGVAVETVLFESFASRLCDLVADQARQWPADLIVVGTHGRRGVGRWLLGSDAEQILRMAPVPVLLVPAAHVRRDGATEPVASPPRA